MRKQETKKYAVDGGEVEITLQALGGIEGSKLGVKLGGMLGPSVIALFTSAQSQTGGAEAGRMLFDKLTPDVFEGLLKQLTKGAQMKTVEGEFEDVTVQLLDNTFSGNVAGLYRLLFDAVGLNFQNFSQGLGISSSVVDKLKAILDREVAKVGASPSSQSISTGVAGV